MSNQKQKLYEQFLKRRTPENKETYKAYKNLFEMIKRKSKKHLYSAKLIKFQGDTKKTWHIIKEQIGKSGIDKSPCLQKIFIDKLKMLVKPKLLMNLINFS